MIDGTITLLVGSADAQAAFVVEAFRTSESGHTYFGFPNYDLTPGSLVIFSREDWRADVSDEEAHVLTQCRQLGIQVIVTHRPGVRPTRRWVMLCTRAMHVKLWFGRWLSERWLNCYETQALPIGGFHA